MRSLLGFTKRKGVKTVAPGLVRPDGVGPEMGSGITRGVGAFTLAVDEAVCPGAETEVALVEDRGSPRSDGFVEPGGCHTA